MPPKDKKENSKKDKQKESKDEAELPPENPSGYNQPFLQMDGKKGKKKGGPNGRRKASMKNTDAQQYLAETTYHADLTVMYEFNPEHATCAYNQQMEYTPVQVLVKPEIKHLHEHKNVLL